MKGTTNAQRGAADVVQNTSKVEILGASIQNATDSQPGIMSAADHKVLTDTKAKADENAETLSTTVSRISTCATGGTIDAQGNIALITGDGNVAMTGTTVQTVGGEVTNGKLRIVVNGVESGDIPLPESIPLRGYVENLKGIDVTKYTNIFSPQKVLKSWVFDPFGISSSAPKYNGTLNYFVRTSSSGFGVPELVTEQGISYYKYPDYDGNEPTITQYSLDTSNSSAIFLALTEVACRNEGLYPYLIYINGKKSCTIRFKCIYYCSEVLYSVREPDKYIYISISVPNSELPASKNMRNVGPSETFYIANSTSSSATTIWVYPVGVEVI